jgi:hypothetical protein
MNELEEVTQSIPELKKRPQWKNDWLNTIIIIILLICVVVAVQYYYNMEMRECTKNPLIYSAKYMEEKYGYEFVGIGRFKIKGVSPIITFDKKGVNVNDFENQIIAP